MDLKERSPSFLGVKIPKSAERTSSAKSQTMKFKPMPSIQLLQSLKMYSPMETPASSTKKLNIKPARTNELNLNEFKTSPKVITRNVRKQLWSVGKGDSKWNDERSDKIRRITVMKPGRESLRKSVYSRPSLAQPKKNITKNQTKILSMNDTLPLLDMEQFTLTKIKRTLFSAQQGKPLNQRKTTSHINVNNKLPTVSTYNRKIVKPSIVITPVEKSAKKSLNKTTSNNKPKIGTEKKPDNTMGLMVEKLSNIEDKIGSFDDIKALLCTICVHLGIEVPVNILGKQEKKPKNKSCSNIKNEEISPSFKKDVPSFKKDVPSTKRDSLPTINKNIANNTEFKETIYKLSPFVPKTLDISKETCDTELNFSPSALKLTNQLENIENNTFTESNSVKLEVPSPKTNSQLEKVETATNTKSDMKLSPRIFKEPTTTTINNKYENIDKETNTEQKPIENEKHKTENNKNDDHKSDNNKEDSAKTPINLKNISLSTQTKQEKNPSKPEDTPKPDHKTHKIESSIKLKKTWINQFEQIENKLLNNSNESVNLHSSPDNSPILPLQIDKIVNDDEDTISGIAVKKSPSTSNLHGANTSLRKKIFFKETDLLTESICGYNELRGELPQFLSTPVNKTNKAMSFMTPSVQGNEKKLISRRVQEQLLRLNDC